MKHLLKLLDLTSEEIMSILELAETLRSERKRGIRRNDLAGKTLAMVFAKSSTRTRVSFETGMYYLGGHAVYISADGSQIGRGEPTADTARVLGRYCDAIMLRTYEQSEAEDYAEYSGVPVINGLTDFAHPCQVLADLQTIRAYKGGTNGLKLAWIGDGVNMANSLIVGALKCGMTVSAAIPKGYGPAAEVLDFAKPYGGAFELTEKPEVAARDADVVVTDVWTSMGQESEKACRMRDFAGYQVNDEIMRLAKEDAMVLHCLPAHRGEEITEEVFEAHANEIFDEAENRLYAQMAVLITLLK